jgi:hypothetical protein
MRYNDSIMHKRKPEVSYHHGLELESSFKKDVTGYIKSCHLEDGGYFFARVLPSGGLDTYFAVKSLSILGVKPDRPTTTAGFFTKDIKTGRLEGAAGIFLAVEVLNELGRLNDEVRSYTVPRIMALQNDTGGFGAYENIAVEVTSELEETYQAVKALQTLGAEPDKQKVGRFVSGLLNPDGGYGREGYSTLASTYYATEIYKLLYTEHEKLTVTRDYLRKREADWQVNFIEDLYWLAGGLDNLGEKPNYPDKIFGFVMECRRTNGGFTRFTEMGITTLEYTYYALALLNEVGVL